MLLLVQYSPSRLLPSLFGSRVSSDGSVDDDDVTTACDTSANFYYKNHFNNVGHTTVKCSTYQYVSSCKDAVLVHVLSEAVVGSLTLRLPLTEQL